MSRIAKMLARFAGVVPSWSEARFRGLTAPLFPCEQASFGNRISFDLFPNLTHFPAPAIIFHTRMGSIVVTGATGKAYDRDGGAEREGEPVESRPSVIW